MDFDVPGEREKGERSDLCLCNGLRSFEFVPEGREGEREGEKIPRIRGRGEAADFYNIPGISSDPENNRLDYGKRQNTSL